jgi:hypothetical protein
VAGGYHILVFLNVKLVVEQTLKVFESDAMWYWKLDIGDWLILICEPVPGHDIPAIDQTEKRKTKSSIAW